MTTEEFDKLYQALEFQNKFKAICHDVYQGYIEAFASLGIFDCEDLKQEGLIKVWLTKSGQPINYYIKAVQNHLLDMVRKAVLRDEIAPTESIDMNMAYSIYGKSEQ